MSKIKEKAQAVVWECERQERLATAKSRLRKYDGDYEKFQRITIESQFNNRPVIVDVRDLDEKAIERIYQKIEDEIVYNLENS